MGRKYTLQGFEQLAQNTIKQFDPNLVAGEPVAIPITELIELHLGLDVQALNLSPDESIHGVTVFEDCIIPYYSAKSKQFVNIDVSAGTIIIESKLFDKHRANRLRFTLAHELAHWLIHQENFTGETILAYKSSNNVQNNIEREADQLAAALLMPYGRVKVAYTRLAGKLSHDAVIQQLATLFCVSPQAMSIRLEWLDFVNHSRNENIPVKQSFNCPFCGNHLLEITSGRQPFQSNVLGMELLLPCLRCGEGVRLQLENAN